MIIKEILPPFFYKWLINIKKKLKNNKLIDNPKKQKLDLYYDPEMAKILETWGERNAWIEVQHIFEDKKGKVLDIACGTGTVIKLLSANNDLDIYGCDISSYLIDRAKSKNIDKSKLLVCDATKLPYDLNFFDYSYSVGSLEHFTEDGIKCFLKSCYKVTKKNSYHMIPVSRSGKNHGWIENYQSYFNNSIGWWSEICKSAGLECKFLDSTWEDEISIGKWLIIKK